MAAKGKNVGKYSLKIRESNGTWGNWTGPQDTEKECLQLFNEKYNNDNYKGEVFAIFDGPKRWGKVLRILKPGEVS